MLQTYRSRFPNERVILDPLLQMQQKIAIAHRASGEPAPDDFLALSAGLASAWNGLPLTSSGGNNSNGAIASLDYRERSLSLKLKPQIQQDEQFDAFQQQLQTALADRKLMLATRRGGFLANQAGAMKQTFSTSGKRSLQQRHAALLQTAIPRMACTYRARTAFSARRRHAAIAVALFYLILIAPAFAGPRATATQLAATAHAGRAIARAGRCRNGFLLSTDTTSMLSRQKLEGTVAPARIEGAERQHFRRRRATAIRRSAVCAIARMSDHLAENAATGCRRRRTFSAKDKAGMVSATLQLNRQKDE
jgi:hypothetical protein